MTFSTDSLGVKMRLLLIIALLFPAAAAAEQACPSSFFDFLSHFENSREFQQEHIVFPLKYSFVDTAIEPEPKTIKRDISRSEVASRTEPIYPPPSVQQLVPLVREMLGDFEARKLIRLYKPDTGYLLEYHFERIGGCWKLVTFYDSSM
jgi:hypothetical protein